MATDLQKEPALSGYQVRIIESLSRIESGVQDLTRRITELENRVEDKYVRKDQHERLEGDIARIDGVLNKAVYAILGVVGSVVTSAIIAILKFGGLPR